ncbi:MAG: EAL domain-containing protein [Pseudomonadota bacterium]|nr:EAL domain-containing protein [Pseudomonadota bacterium]
MTALITTISYWILASLWLLVLVLYVANFSYIRNARGTIGAMLLTTGLIAGVEFFTSDMFRDFLKTFAMQKDLAFNSFGFDLDLFLTTENVRLIAGIVLLAVLLFWLIPLEVKERSKLERSLEESEERFRTITENTTDITIIYRSDAGFTYISPSVYKVIGVKPEEFAGKGPDEILHPDDYDVFMNAVSVAIKHENKTVAMPDFRVKDDKGKWVYFEGRMTHMPNVRGVNGLVLNCRDIQKRKEAQELLNHRLDMDMMISQISTEFINTTNQNIEEKLQKTLEKLGCFAELSHVHFFQKKDAQDAYHFLIGWSHDDHPCIFEDIEDIQPDAFPWMFEKLELLETVYIPDVFKISPKAKAERKFFTEHGLRTLLVIPVSKEGALTGFLMLDSVSLLKKWNKHDLSLLNVVAEIVSNALERHSAQENLVTLSRAVEQSMSSVLIFTPEAEVKYVNKKFEEVTGYSAEEFVGRNIHDFEHVEGFDERFQDVLKTVLEGREWRGEVVNRKKDGSDLWEYVVVSPIKDSQGEVKHILSVREDITEKKDFEDKLIHQANYDDLTNIPNRVLAHDRLSEAITRAQLNKESVAAIIIGLDTFKKVNETLGHHVGDQLLIEASLRLKHYVPELGTLARLGGDEFLIVLPIDHDDYAEIVASRILESFTDPFLLGDHEVTVTASMGISISPNDGDDPSLILRNAGSAMHKAKDSGRNNFQFFAEEMHSDALKRVQMEGYLRRALEFDELELYYQPIVDTASRKVIGAEALVRWSNPQLGFVSPADFIPLAEDIGLIVLMGDWILKTACKQAAEWQGQEGFPSYVSVNVSVRQFKGQNFATTVEKTLEEVGLPPECLKVEVTESLLVDEEVGGTVDTALQALNNMGVHISLDDFGTGYSSLSYLKKYNFHTLKIDRSFVRDVPDDREDKALVEAIMAMAHSLKLEVVAEGVEEQEQIDYLSSLGCDALQGFFYSKPLPDKQFADLIVNWDFAKEKF